MQEQPPNTALVYPSKLKIAPPTPNDERLTVGHETIKYSNEKGEEFFEISESRFPPDQMFVVSLLSGRKGEKPIVPCSAIVAKKNRTGGEGKAQWHYFSHRTPASEMSEMSMEEALACQLILYYAFAENDHDVAFKSNVQLSFGEDPSRVHCAFFDFHPFSNFRTNLHAFAVDSFKFERSLQFAEDKYKISLDRTEVKERLEQKLKEVEALLKGEQGIRYLSDIVAHLPHIPYAFGGDAMELDVVKANIARFQGEVLDRIRQTLILFETHEISTKE